MKLNFDEVSPITNNKCVLVEKETDGTVFKVCTESGYVSYPDKWKIGTPEYDMLGFIWKEEGNGYYHFHRVGSEVKDPLFRRPDAILSQYREDSKGSLWLQNLWASESWCLHPIVRELELNVNTERWGISPVIIVRVSRLSDESNNQQVLETIDKEVGSGKHYFDPSYGCLSMAIDKDNPQIIYHFADYTKSRWYDNYKSAYEAFKKLNNEQ